MLLPAVYAKVFKPSLFKRMLCRSSLELGFPSLSRDKDPFACPSVMMDAQSRFRTAVPGEG